MLNALALPGVLTGAPCHSATERRMQWMKIYSSLIQCDLVELFAVTSIPVGTLHLLSQCWKPIRKARKPCIAPERRTDRSVDWIGWKCCMEVISRDRSAYRSSVNVDFWNGILSDIWLLNTGLAAVHSLQLERWKKALVALATSWCRNLAVRQIFCSNCTGSWEGPALFLE